MNDCIDQQNVTEVGPRKSSSTPYFFIGKISCLFVEIRSCLNFPEVLELARCQSKQENISAIITIKY
jgi:hypothetical protein